VEIDEQPAFTVPATVVAALGLEAGAILSDDAEEVLGREADAEAAYRTALRGLEHRPYAKRDLARRLVLKGHPPEAADRAVARAEQAGLIDDAAFARHYVETRFGRGRGPARLRRELQGFGVAPSIIEQEVTAGVTPDAANARMIALIRKRREQLEGVPVSDRKRRILAFLARRGFHGYEAVKAVEEVIGESTP
jgi:regulatory protein